MKSPIFIAGSTAVGKSEIALLLAEKIGGEIISVDSMQVYRGLDIGTIGFIQINMAQLVNVASGGCWCLALAAQSMAIICVRLNGCGKGKGNGSGSRSGVPSCDGDLWPRSKILATFSVKMG